MPVQLEGWLIGGAVILIWLAVRLLQRKPVTGSRLAFPLLGLFLAYFIASIFSVDTRLSLEETGLILAYGLFFLMVNDITSGFFQPEVWIDGLLWAVGIVSLLAVGEVWAWYQSWAQLSGSFSTWPPFSYRLTSWMGHANIYAIAVASLAPLAAVRLVKARSWAVRILMVFWWLASLAGLVFASSRSGWMAAGGALVLVALLCWAGSYTGWKAVLSRIKARISPAFIAVCLLVIAALAVFAWLASSQLRNPTHGPLLQSRSEYWPTAWNMFTSSPWVGKGPQTYYRFFLADNPLSRHSFVNTAHSVYLGLAAETGLVGLAAGVWFLVTVLLGWLRNFQHTRQADRPWLAAIAAGLAAMFFNGIGDQAILLVPTVFILCILLALSQSPFRSKDSIQSGEEQSTSASQPVPSLPVWIPFLLLVIVSAGGLWSARAQATFESAISLAEQGAWTAAAERFETAAGQDPYIAWYWLEAGYARGMAAQSDDTQLDAAILNTFQGIVLDPSNAVSHANLAVLYEQREDLISATASMQEAARLDPTNYSYQLNLGRLHEKAGDTIAANEAYINALKSSSLLSDSVFWEQTPARKAARTAWDGSNWAPSQADQISQEGLRALDSGDQQKAMQLFQQAQQMDPYRPLSYRGLGLVAWKNGDLAQAYDDFNICLKAYGSFNDKMPYLLCRLDLSDLSEQMGKSDAALDFGLQAFDMLDHYNSYGIGTYGYNIYAWWAFHRESVPGDTLPGLARADLSTQLAQRFVTLGNRLQSAGQNAQACNVYRRVLESAPETEEAVQGVKNICQPGS